MQKFQFKGTCIQDLMETVDRQLSLSPLELLAVTNYEVRCEQRELGIVDGKDGE